MSIEILKFIRAYELLCNYSTFVFIERLVTPINLLGLNCLCNRFILMACLFIYCYVHGCRCLFIYICFLLIVIMLVDLCQWYIYLFIIVCMLVDVYECISSNYCNNVIDFYQLYIYLLIIVYKFISYY